MNTAMKICLLPLDSRPCTYRFPAQLAAIFGGCEVVQPPIEKMDFFQTPSCGAAIWQWLLEHSADADYLVLSVEQLLYGGLVASRTAAKPEEALALRLSQLSELKRQNPRLKIYAFNIIMRATVSTLSRESQRWWQQIAQYSRLSFLAETARTEHRAEARRALEDLTNQLPPDVLAEFLTVRRRNHGVNRRCVALCADGVFDKLVLLQEDCAPQSLQLLEQQELLRLIEEQALGSRVWLHNGTDEAAMELVVLAAAGDTARPVLVLWLGDDREFTAKYEDRPFIENLRSHLRLMNLREDPSAPDCLVILPPRQRQGDYCPRYEDPVPYTPQEYQCMAAALRELAGQGKRCYLLDVCYANGGDLSFFAALGAKPMELPLYGYAAWNTASNSLGTVLAQLTASRGRNSAENRRFTAERLLDDLFYQALVRQALARKLDTLHEDCWCLQDRDAAQRLLLETIAENAGYLAKLFGGGQPQFSASLPWPRIFEADLAVLTKTRDKEEVV